VNAITSNSRLIIATSSSALFDLQECDEIYRLQGLDAYTDYQIAHENDPLAPGQAFELVKKLLSLNEQCGREDRVEVILLSRNTADTGLRVFNSIEHHGLGITRAAFTGGGPPYRYMNPFGCHLFLSARPADVRETLENGMAAATILSSDAGLPGGEVKPDIKVPAKELRIAFDGDAVLFSDESERIYKQQGLAAFARNEKASADTPMGGGPFKGFLQALHLLQSEFAVDDCPIRTALVTARAAPSHERVIKTLRAWQIRIDESLFLGGMSKSAFLLAYGADIFFDDQEIYCSDSRNVVPTGHVPHGIANELSTDENLK